MLRSPQQKDLPRPVSFKQVPIRRQGWQKGKQGVAFVFHNEKVPGCADPGLCTVLWVPGLLSHFAKHTSKKENEFYLQRAYMLTYLLRF